MEDNTNEKIEAILAAMFDENAVAFDELVADLLQDKAASAIEIKRDEFKQTAFSGPEEESEDDEQESTEELETTPAE